MCLACPIIVSHNSVALVMGWHAAAELVWPRVLNVAKVYRVYR